MKVSFTIAEKSDGTFVVLYAGTDAVAAKEAAERVIAEPKGYVEVAAFRKPHAFKQRKFECPVANARRAAAEQADRDRQAREHKEALAALEDQSKGKGKSKGKPAEASRNLADGPE